MNASPLPSCRASHVLATLLLAALAACGERDVTTPPPLGHRPGPEAQALGDLPDTQSMGAGPSVAANCGMRTEEALQRINAARAAGRRCGARNMPPAAALRWDTQLYSAASGHSADMARRNYFQHVSPEGTQVSARVSASQYKWKSVGENLAGGDRSIDDAVEGWLNSPDHCENLMDPKFVDVAVACVAQPGTEWGTYWTMVLGRK